MKCQDFAARAIIAQARTTVEPPFNESQYNEVLGITKDFLYPSNSE